MSREFFSKERWLRKQEERKACPFLRRKFKNRAGADPYYKARQWFERHRPPYQAYSIACYNGSALEYIGTEPLESGRIYPMSDIKDWDDFVESNRNRFLHYTGYGSACWHNRLLDMCGLFLSYEKLPYTSGELKEPSPLYWRYDRDDDGASFVFLLPTINPRHITHDAVKLFFHRAIISEHLKFESRKEGTYMSSSIRGILQGI